MLAVIKGSRQEQPAREFATFINDPDGRQILRKYGLTLANEVPTQP